MKRIAFVTLIIVFTVSFFSCTEEKDGDWDDNIKLSAKAVNFNASSDSVTITTEGSWWWITDVSVNGDYYGGTEDIYLDSAQYTIDHDCFVVERRDKNTLFIRLEANPLSVQRTIVVDLEAGDYFDRVTITQEAGL